MKVKFLAVFATTLLLGCREVEYSGYIVKDRTSSQDRTLEPAALKAVATEVVPRLGRKYELVFIEIHGVDSDPLRGVRYEIQLPRRKNRGIVIFPDDARQQEHEDSLWMTAWNDSLKTVTKILMDGAGLSLWNSPTSAVYEEFQNIREKENTVCLYQTDLMDEKDNVLTDLDTLIPIPPPSPESGLRVFVLVLATSSDNWATLQARIERWRQLIPWPCVRFIPFSELSDWLRELERDIEKE